MWFTRWWRSLFEVEHTGIRFSKRDVDLLKEALSDVDERAAELNREVDRRFKEARMVDAILETLEKHKSISMPDLIQEVSSQTQAKGFQIRSAVLNLVYTGKAELCEHLEIRKVIKDDKEKDRASS